MPGPVTYSRSGPISHIVMNDGKANVMSAAMLNALLAAFDEAERDNAIVVLSARGKHFSGGFDLGVFATGSAEEQYLMVKAGAELALRILSFPLPVVAACHGNAFPMGAFLIMASDHRIAAEGDYRIGMNEVAIGITPPRFAIELARQRLLPAYLSRTVVTGEMFGPAEAVTAGFFDRLVPAADLARAAEETRFGDQQDQSGQSRGRQAAVARRGDREDPPADRRGHHAAVWQRSRGESDDFRLTLIVRSGREGDTSRTTRPGRFPVVSSVASSFETPDFALRATPGSSG